MNALKLHCIILFLLLCVGNAYAQVQNLGNDALTTVIKKSEKKYKIVYLFCDYCQVSIDRFPRLVELVNGNDSVDLFPICAQDSSEVAAYMEKYRVSTPFYLINQNRKKKAISFYNPIKAACKYLEKDFNMQAHQMGASDYFVLDKENRILMQTNWDIKECDYFNELEKRIVK